MKTLIALLSSLVIGSAFAATQCTEPGASCTGSIGVSVEVGPLVLVSNVKDIKIPDWKGGAYSDDPALAQNFCVFSNSAGTGGTYTIQFSASSGFELVSSRNPAYKTKYQLEFTSGTDVTPVTNVVTGPTTLNNQLGSASMNCNGNQTGNTTLKINILSPDRALIAGDYTDTLTMLVTPT
jgi:hypothetical protein